MRLANLAVLALLFLTRTALSADLNAPVTDHPTLGSEIERGWHASFDCGLQHTMDADGMDACVSAAASQAEQQHSNSDPFILGLYAGATLHFASALKVDMQDAASNAIAAGELGSDQKEATSACAVYTRLKGQLHVTDKEVASTLSSLTEDGKRQAVENLSGPACKVVP